ncbi:MAG: malto-oligosyltrehalose trehalohydrolase [Verrucomicrobiales bacterium]|nr:malto-oligosyltrehalose trehalohydrolase [Verrucomicrobiales bacterium]
MQELRRQDIHVKTNERPAPRAELRRRLPIGAEVLDGAVHFRVWAPASRNVAVEINQEHCDPWRVETMTPLEPEPQGYFSGFVPAAQPGTLYKFRLDTGSFPDPAARFQPEGPHGPSQVIDPDGFEWTDAGWKGVRPERQVIYEMHIGTFTPEGTWSAASKELEELARLGVTLLEIMPIAEFAGRFGWGYDGVDLFAPTRRYGRPDDFRAFVDGAHAVGLGVILDVVYNHLGPDGNYLKHFSPDYFTDQYVNEWGEAINFDGENSGPVREFFVANAAHWIEEFHLDGARLDATQQIFDASKEHILAAITRRVRAAAKGRSTYLVAENERQDVRLVRPASQGGDGMDALWNDDFHHAAMVALTGRVEAYYTDYRGSPQEFVSAAKWGFLYQGQRYKWQKMRRGTPTFGLEPTRFVTFIQNHDQVANSLRGLRIHQVTSPGRLRAMTALLLLIPATPMLFQGQEFAASAPFFYFADHNPALAKLVAQGRRAFLRQFRTIACPEANDLLPPPESEQTFLRCKLDFSERQKHTEIYELHRDLLRLRREDPTFRSVRSGSLDGAVLGPEAFVLRFFGEQNDDRLLVVNFGTDLPLDPAPEPLLAPVEGCVWQALWSSEAPCYGGCGTPALETEENWLIHGHAAVVLAPGKRDDAIKTIPSP